MSFLNPRSGAEASDSLASLTAAALGLAAVIYSVNVAETFVSASTANLLGNVQIIAAAGLVLGYLPLLIYFKSRGGRPAGKPEEDSYLSSLFRQASLTAFSVTLGFMLALSIIGDGLLEQMTAETAVDLAITFAMAVFALSFFVINRLTGAAEDKGDVS